MVRAATVRAAAVMMMRGAVVMVVMLTTLIFLGFLGFLIIVLSSGDGSRSIGLCDACKPLFLYLLLFCH